MRVLGAQGGAAVRALVKDPESVEAVDSTPHNCVNRQRALVVHRSIMEQE